jgi:glycosyltransferase involved in cell wall biosynthesis
MHPGALAFEERLLSFFPVVDPARFVRTDKARSAARERLGLTGDSLVIGNVGNLNPMKGHELFIRAAAKLRPLRPDTKFVILGAQGPNQTRYIAGLRETARALALRLGEDLVVVDPGADVSTLASAFDIFWLTSHSRSEGMPTVVGEAMALELPVVATRVGAVAEAVKDGVTGTLVPPGDADALAEATLRYVDDAELRASAGAAGRMRAQLLYAGDVCAERHVEAFRLAIDHRQSRARRRSHIKAGESFSDRPHAERAAATEGSGRSPAPAQPS